VNVGLPRDIAMKGQERAHAVGRDEGAVCRRVEGEHRRRRQGDLQGHGGEAPAVSSISDRFLRYWERETARAKGIRFGQFGENFTVEGLRRLRSARATRYGVGKRAFEVTQPA